MLNENRYLKIYEGQCYKKKYQKRYQKIIVFDLDETIGSFGDLYILWSGLQKIYTFDKENVQREFNSIMDLYPEFLRYGFMQILEFLYTKKKQGDCDKIFISFLKSSIWVLLNFEIQISFSATLFSLSAVGIPLNTTE